MPTGAAAGIATGPAGPTLMRVAQPELSNAAIADALEELGDLYELDGAIVHRVLAYRGGREDRARGVRVGRRARARRAARPSCRASASTLQEKILALVETGTIPAAEKLRAKFPPGLIAITRLPGLGPKRARLLHSELGIDSLEALREAALAAAPAHRARARAEARGTACWRRSPTAPASAPAPRVLLPRALELGEPLVAGADERSGSPGTEVRARRLGAPAGRQRQGPRPDRRHHPARRRSPRASASSSRSRA